MWLLGRLDPTQVSIYIAAAVSIAGAATGWVRGRSEKDLGDSSEWRQGTRDLLDQVQEERGELKKDVAECREECAKVRKDLDHTRAELYEARREITRLKKQLQERL